MPFKVLCTSFQPGLHSSYRINGLVLHLIQIIFKWITPPFPIHTIYRSTLIRCLINPSTANYPSSTMQRFCCNSPRSRLPKEPSQSNSLHGATSHFHSPLLTADVPLIQRVMTAAEQCEGLSLLPLPTKVVENLPQTLLCHCHPLIPQKWQALCILQPPHYSVHI